MTWISSIASQIMDAVSGLFLNALGTDMVTIEEIAFSFADLLVVIAYAALVAGMVYAGMKGVF